MTREQKVLEAGPRAVGKESVGGRAIAAHVEVCPLRRGRPQATQRGRGRGTAAQGTPRLGRRVRRLPSAEAGRRGHPRQRAGRRGGRVGRRTQHRRSPCPGWQVPTESHSQGRAGVAEPGPPAPSDALWLLHDPWPPPTSTLRTGCPRGTRGLCSRPRRVRASPQPDTLWGRRGDGPSTSGCPWETEARGVGHPPCMGPLSCLPGTQPHRGRRLDHGLLSPHQGRRAQDGWPGHPAAPASGGAGVPVCSSLRRGTALGPARAAGGSPQCACTPSKDRARPRPGHCGCSARQEGAPEAREGVAEPPALLWVSQRPAIISPAPLIRGQPFMGFICSSGIPDPLAHLVSASCWLLPGCPTSPPAGRQVPPQTPQAWAAPPALAWPALPWGELSGVPGDSSRYG